MNHEESSGAIRFTLEIYQVSAYHFCFLHCEIPQCRVELSNPDHIEPHNPHIPNTQTQGDNHSQHNLVYVYTIYCLTSFFKVNV